MKKLLLVFVTVCLTVSVHAQATADIGLWGGSVSNIYGDMDDNTPFQSLNLNYGVYFRYNFNPRVALRAMFLNGTFENKGTIEGYDWSFDKEVQDFTLQVEINYLRYILGNKKLRFSPYVSLGIGAAFFPFELDASEMLVVNPDYPISLDVDESVTALSIPLGIGFKYTIGKRLGIGAEYQLRKYYSDKLDNLWDPFAYENDEGEIVSYNESSHNYDWAGYLGVQVTYRIYLKKKDCPAYDAKYW